MNTKLSNMWEQATKMANNMVPANLGKDYSAAFEQAQRKNFAKLIVAACANAADMAQEADCRYAGDYVVESMDLGIDEGAADWRDKYETW